MVSDTETLKNIPSGKPVRVFLPLLNGPDRFRAQCVYELTTPPHFTLIFASGTLPESEIDVKKSCIVSIDMGGPTVSLEAVIKDIANPQTLNLVVENTVSHEQMREFFRVDATAQVIAKSFQTTFFNQKKDQWSLGGQTVDISGSGILAMFPEEPPPDKQVLLEITIPSAEPEVIKILADKVRTKKLNDGLFEIAYHFADISMENRDKIIGCCLVLQRKMLRLKVQVRNQLL